MGVSKGTLTVKHPVVLHRPCVSRIYQLVEVLFKFCFSIRGQFGSWGISPSAHETFQENPFTLIRLPHAGTLYNTTHITKGEKIMHEEMTR